MSAAICVSEAFLSGAILAGMLTFLAFVFGLALGDNSAENAGDDV